MGKTDKILRRTKHRTIMTAADIAIFFVALISMIGCDSTEKNNVPDCEVTAPLDSLFSAMFADHDPGAVVMIIKNDTVKYDRGFGLATLDSRMPSTDSTIYNLSSASKLFTTTAIAKLAEEGRLSLDDSLTKFFPELGGKFFDKITVRNLLSQTSGLPDLRPRNEEEWDNYLDTHHSIFNYSPDYRLYSTETEHMQIFQHLTAVDHPVGTFYDQTDASYILLAPLIERVTGEKFETWMDRTFFKPLGMNDTFYYGLDTSHPRLAHGYQRADKTKEAITYRSDDGRWDEFDYGESEFFLTKADRGACSSARDYTRFQQALFQGRILRPESLKTLTQPIVKIENVPYASYGLGIAIKDVPGYPRKFYHLNNNGGYSTVQCSFPEHKIYYVVFSSRNDWDLRATATRIDSIFKTRGWI